MADVRGDLIFDGFEPTTAVPGHYDEHDLDLSSGHTQEIAPMTALALELERTASPEARKLNPAAEAAESAALDPHKDPTSSWACVIGTSDSSLAIGSKLHTSAPIETDRAPIVKFISADIFRHSPLGDVLNSLKKLSSAGTHSRIISGSNWRLMTENFASPPRPLNSHYRRLN